MRVGETRLTPELIDLFTKAGHWTSTTAAELLERNARDWPDKEALVDDHRRLTYRVYQTQVRALAAHLVELGLTKDDVLAVQLPNWVEFAITVNAAMLVGIPFCQFHSSFRAKEVEFILSFTEAAAVVVPQRFRGFDYPAMMESLRPRLPKLRYVLLVGDDVPPGLFDLRSYLATRENVPERDELLRKRLPHANAIARVAFTSGTTGDPKAVLHTHNTTNAGGRFLNRDRLITAESVMLVFLPVGLNWGFFDTNQAVLAGCKIVYMEKFDPEEALAVIEAQRVTHISTAPTSLVAMLDVPGFPRYDLSSLRVITVGGASCPIEVIRRTRAKMPGILLEMYGSLETNTTAITAPDDDPEQVCGLVGRILPEMGVRLIDDDGRDVPTGSIGEIIAFGPSVMVGYHNNPDANARSFTKDDWYRTGDLGIFNKQGYLKIVGRKKEMIIRGGANVYPREIEEVLVKYPKVHDVVVMGVPHPTLGEIACACIVPQPGEEITLAEVAAFLGDKIARYKIPERVEIFEELPRTPTGKVERGAVAGLLSKR